MTLDTLLNIIEICVTIFVGFYLTHLYNVRDSQTRAIKDEFIQSIVRYKAEIQELYTKIIVGKLTCKDIIQWHKTHVINYVALDNSIFGIFDVLGEHLGDVYGAWYSTLTGLDDFNNQWNNDTITISNESLNILNTKYQHLLIQINAIISIVNDAKRYNIFVRVGKKIKADYTIARSIYKSSKTPHFKSVLYIVRHFLWVNIKEILFAVLFAFCSIAAIVHIKQNFSIQSQGSNEMHQIATELNTINETLSAISNRVDTINSNFPKTKSKNKTK